MGFTNKLDDTYQLLNKLDDLMNREANNEFLKKQIISLSENLETYKNIDYENVIFKNDKINLKMQNVLNRINKIEMNVKNKLLITQKYNSYINS